jgi:integrase
VARILTQRAVEAAKPKDKRYTLADGIAPGLNLVVQPTGAKVYRLWTRIHGKQVPITIGDASLTTLAEARGKAKGLLAAIVNGEDPREAKRAAVRTASETVEAVARSFIERHAKVHNRLSSWQETERLIARNILPAWGRRPITSIARRDVIELLDVVVDRGAPVAANRVLTAGRKMFNWAIDRGLLETSPFERVKAPTPETSRDRTPLDSELALILRAADLLCFPFGPFVKLLVFLGQRRAEVAGMRWSELDEGLTLWTLPRERAKNNIEHQVPIAPEVREILVGLPRFEGSDFVLTFTGTVSITGYSQCKIALDAAIAELNGGEPIPPWRIHDLRRAMASGMAKAGVQMPVVEKILNHVSGSFAGVAGVYQRHDFADEKRKALEIWARHLRSLETGDERGNVVSFESRSARANSSAIL